MVEQSSGLQIDNLSKVSGKELFRDSQYLVNVLHLRTGIYFRNSFVVVLFVVKIRRPYVCLSHENHVALPANQYRILSISYRDRLVINI